MDGDAIREVLQAAGTAQRSGDLGNNLVWFIVPDGAKFGHQHTKLSRTDGLPWGGNA